MFYQDAGITNFLCDLFSMSVVLSVMCVNVRQLMPELYLGSWYTLRHTGLAGFEACELLNFQLAVKEVIKA